MKQFGIVGAFALAAVLAGCAGAPKAALSDDVSRSELFSYGVNEEGIVRSFPVDFTFPANVRDNYLFGIDVSHHQGEINWDTVLAHKVSFVYMKASEGKTYYDPMFQTNWNALSAARAKGTPVNRGAYHFLSATAEADKQAKNYLEIVGKLGPDDLAPCLDMEWDKKRDKGVDVLDEKGKPIDRWADYTSAEIIEKAKTWLEAVEKKTGKRPIIYTNAEWWKKRIGKDMTLAGYQIWAADYGNFALNREFPRVPDGHNWIMWQLTEKGQIPGASITKIDVNVFQGKPEDYKTWCCSTPAPKPGS